ncbi:hypothetical protein VB796_13590 [Arcicella sp. LKC2W]|uniref:hypothetical protein n=1 Tax=Arcicella sp. LKC2W TaxID=2984198 RepID=UPI002B1F8D2C|nr:hypothetical protein [Arcicella sp. LKC2W]MEA5460083.1 hypothetical protein [Arcicella sp. LKC2W]
MKKLLLLSIFIVTISCQKSSNDVSPTANCYMSKLTLTTKTTVPLQSTSTSYNIVYDASQKISKIYNTDYGYLAEYVHSTNKVIVKTYDVFNGKNTLKTTNTITLNSKDQIIQTLEENEIEKKAANYVPITTKFEYNDKGYVTKSGFYTIAYEYNSTGLPSKITNNYIVNGQIFLSNSDLYEYYTEYKVTDFANKEALYDYGSHGSYNLRPFMKFVKSIKHYEANILKYEALFTYAFNTDNKKVKNITQINYNYTSTGVKINTPTTSIQEFEYQCK